MKRLMNSPKFFNKSWLAFVFTSFLKSYEGVSLRSKGDFTVKAWRCGRGEKWLGLRVRLNSKDGSNGRHIGNRRWSCVVHIGTAIVWTPPVVPAILLVTVKVMRPGALPPIGISMGVVIIRVTLKRWIWVGLGAQGA